MELRYRDVQERYRTMAMYGLFVSELFTSFPFSLFAVLFIYLFFGYARSSLLQGLFLVVASRGYSLAAVLELLIVVASLVAEHRL